MCCLSVRTDGEPRWNEVVALPSCALSAGMSSDQREVGRGTIEFAVSWNGGVCDSWNDRVCGSMEMRLHVSRLRFDGAGGGSFWQQCSFDAQFFQRLLVELATSAAFSIPVRKVCRFVPYGSHEG